MNKIRRKAIQELKSRSEELMEELDSLKDAEEEYRDNIPENLQGSERYEKAENAVDNLESAYYSLEEVISYLEEATE